MSEIITRNIKKLLSKNNITEYKLCKTLNLNQASFSISKKKNSWSLNTLIKVSQYFNVPIDIIIGGSLSLPPNRFKDETEKKKIFIVRAIGLINEGDIQSAKGNFIEAIECYSLALRYIEDADKDFNLEPIIKEIKTPYLDLTDKIKFDPTICLFRIATTYFKFLQDWESAKIYYERFKEVNEKKKNSSNIAFALAGIAACEKNLGNLKNALMMNRKAIEYKENIVQNTKSLKDKTNLHDAERSLASSYSNISTNYFEIGSYNKAIDYSRKAVSLFEKNKNIPEVAVAMNNLANAYSIIGNYEKATLIHKDIENILKNYLASNNINDPAKKSLAMNALAESIENSGNVLRNLKKIKEAGVKYFEALGLKKKLGYPDKLINCYTNLGDYFIRIGNLNDAYNYTKEAIKLSDMINNKFAKIYSLNNLGHIYLLQKEFEKAISAYKSSLEIREEIGNPLYISINLKYLGDAYRIINNFGKSTEYYKFAIYNKKKAREQFGYNIETKIEFFPLDDLYSKELKKLLMLGKIIYAFEFAEKNDAQIKELITKSTVVDFNKLDTDIVEEYNLIYIELNSLYSQLATSSSEESRKINYSIEEKNQILRNLLNQQIKRNKKASKDYLDEDLKCVYKLTYQEGIDLLAA